MHFIAHRGNLEGPNPEKENHPLYLAAAMDAGYSVEADFWVVDGDLWLGHDEPQYNVPSYWDLGSAKFFCHAKNLDALIHLSGVGANVFFQDSDEYVLTYHGIVWPHCASPLVSSLSKTCKIVAVMPEIEDQPLEDIKQCWGICTDYVRKYEELLS